jgi:hypothetical protein
MFQKLKEHKEETGSTHISRTIAEKELKPLSRWVKTQRALYKAGKILPDRHAKLESINFLWDGTQGKKTKRDKKADGEENGEPKPKKAKTTATAKKADDGAKKPAAKRGGAKKVEDAKGKDDDDSSDSKQKAESDKAESTKKTATAKSLPKTAKPAAAGANKTKTAALKGGQEKEGGQAKAKEDEQEKVEAESQGEKGADAVAVAETASPVRGERRSKRAKITSPGKDETPASPQQKPEEKDDRSITRRGRTPRVKYV